MKKLTLLAVAMLVSGLVFAQAKTTTTTTTTTAPAVAKAPTATPELQAKADCTKELGATATETAVKDCVAKKLSKAEKPKTQN